MLHHFRRHLIAGLLVTLPLGVTVFVLLFLFRFLDNLLGPFFARVLGFRIPGLGLLAGFLLILAAGTMASNIIGGRIVQLFDSLMMRIPLARTVYFATKQISDALLQQKRGAFRRAVLLEWPRPGLFTVGFLTGETRGEVQAKTAEHLVNVFVVTTPNPTTGFLCLVPEHQITPLEMSVEDALKLVISAGIATPPHTPEGGSPKS